jgi:hypothetical protein
MSSKANLKRKSPFEARKEFAKGLQIVLSKVVSDYCIADKADECRQYLTAAFSDVPGFSDIHFIEQEEAEFEQQKTEQCATKQRKKDENNETVKLFMHASLKVQQIVDYGSSSLNESFTVPLAEALKKVSEYRNRISQKKVEIMLYNVMIGGFIKRVKYLCDGTRSDFMKFLIQRDCTLSSSMAYFYIQLYELACKFPRFQLCALSLHYVRKHWKCIIAIMENTQQFWTTLS